MKKTLVLIATAVSLIFATKVECQTVRQENSYDLVGIDHFGRSFGTINGYREDRAVGMFFWPWIGQPYANGIYDATKILAEPDGMDLLFKIGYSRKDENGNELSPTHQFHYWGEPLWGYYNSDDEWVIRKQLQMLTLAGVDFIYWDHTNQVVYENVVLKTAKVIKDMRDQGWNAPLMVSYTHSRSIDTIRRIYNNVYRNSEFPDVWYRVNGKPAIIGYTVVEDDLAEAASRGDMRYNPEPLSQEILDYFYFWKADWPFDPSYPDGFTWIEWKNPQPYHAEARMMNVTVASHPGVPMSFSITRPGWVNWGRGWDPVQKKNIPENAEKGTFFQSQWDYAIEFDPPVVAVGGWNEWVALKQPYDGEEMLCDAASLEFSRDIEPMKGGYEDAFYVQLIMNLRRYKADRQNVAKRLNAPLAIDINGSAAQWNKVGYVQVHPDAKQIARDAFGGSKVIRYTQPAPVNALSEVRVSYDRNNLYFLVKTQKAVTAPKKGDEGWFNLYIGTEEPARKGWESYEYVIGKKSCVEAMSVEKLAADYSRTEAGKCKYVRKGNTLQIAVPRSMVGLAAAKGFYFKLAMGCDVSSDIMTTYTSGSAMPMGRLSYQFYFE